MKQCHTFLQEHGNSQSAPFMKSFYLGVSDLILTHYMNCLRCSVLDSHVIAVDDNVVLVSQMTSGHNQMSDHFHIRLHNPVISDY